MGTTNGDLNAALTYTNEEEYDQKKMVLIDPDQWANSTDNLVGGQCYHIVFYTCEMRIIYHCLLL